MSEIRDGLLAIHQSIFADVAADEGVWILVRGTNKASLKYIGQAGYIPKPVECKAKTASQGKNAGLVVCPMLDTSAFSYDKRAVAEKVWKDMVGSDWKWDPNNPDKGLPPGYKIETGTNNYACLRNGGKLIHGDYDLYDIVDPSNLDDQRRVEKVVNGISVYFSPKALSAIAKLNAKLGTPMIQHGDQLSFDDHTADLIYAFSPDRNAGTLIINSFNPANRLASIKSVYSAVFADRGSRKTTDYTWKILEGGKQG